MVTVVRVARWRATHPFMFIYDGVDPRSSVDAPHKLCVPINFKSYKEGGYVFVVDVVVLVHVRMIVVMIVRVVMRGRDLPFVIVCVLPVVLFLSGVVVGVVVLGGGCCCWRCC